MASFTNQIKQSVRGIYVNQSQRDPRSGIAERLDALPRVLVYAVVVLRVGHLLRVKVNLVANFEYHRHPILLVRIGEDFGLDLSVTSYAAGLFSNPVVFEQLL